jgi:hypothetical protein
MNVHKCMNINLYMIIVISYYKQVTMFYNKLFMDSYGVEHLLKMSHLTMHSPKWNRMIQHDYFRKGLYVLFPKNISSYEWILKKIILQLVIINAYSCPNTWHFYSSSFFNKVLKVSWFLINSVFHLFKW